MQMWIRAQWNFDRYPFLKNLMVFIDALVLVIDEHKNQLVQELVRSQ